MSISGERILRVVFAICGVALLWLAVFNVNMWLFSHASFSERAHWIFLPAAFRIIAVLVLGMRGGVGLMLGAYLTLPHASPNDFNYEILLSISSGAAPLIAVLFCKQLFTINHDLNGLNGWHVVALSVSGAAANSAVLNALMWGMGKQQADIEAITAIFVGDVLGAAIVLAAIVLAMTVAVRFIRRA
jgi:hypothetical protein